MKDQRSYNLASRGRNHVISWCRQDCKSVKMFREKRYFVGRIAGVIRTNDMKPLIHNGGKP